jgi:hypothetical protein
MGIIAYFGQVTTDEELSVGKEVLVASVNGDLDFGHVLKYKIGIIDSVRDENGFNIYSIDGAEYIRFEITLFEELEEI